MNKLIRFILKKICARLVQQGYHHQYYITEYYRIMNDAIDKEFYEDNQPTKNYFTQECFDKAKA
jgi:hypothetical protein